jgi:hypothetical protein
MTLQSLLLAIVIGASALTAHAEDRDHQGFWENWRHEDHRISREHVAKVPEASPWAVLGGLFLIGATAYELKNRRSKKAKSLTSGPSIA